MDKIILLGTGTSQGVPMIGCKCKVCASEDGRDKRLRTSAYVEYKGLKIVIDAGPDFRQQMLREDICRLDAILLTHKHKDHTGGLDDVRSLNYLTGKAFPVYCEKEVFESLEMEYSYAFDKVKYPGVPEYEIHLIDEKPFSIKGTEIVPLRVRHYRMDILGFRFGELAYITDGSFIPEQTFGLLKGIRTLIINCVRIEKHISHFCLEEAIAISRSIGAEQTFLTHMSHQMGTHEEITKMLPAGIFPGYDGMEIPF